MVGRFFFRVCILCLVPVVPRGEWVFSFTNCPRYKDVLFGFAVACGEDVDVSRSFGTWRVRRYSQQNCEGDCEEEEGVRFLHHHTTKSSFPFFSDWDSMRLLSVVFGLGAAVAQDGGGFLALISPDLGAESFAPPSSREVRPLEALYDDSYGDEAKEPAVPLRHGPRITGAPGARTEQDETLPEVFHHRKRRRHVAHTQLRSATTHASVDQNHAGFLNVGVSAADHAAGTTPVLEYDVASELVARHERQQEARILSARSTTTPPVFLHSRKQRHEQTQTATSKNAHTAQSQCLDYAAFLKTNAVSGSKLIQMWMNTCAPATHAAPTNNQFKKKCDAVVAAVSPFSDKTNWDADKLCHAVLAALNGL